MGREIERKFLVCGEEWRQGASPVLCRQGYLYSEIGLTIRVRVQGAQAFLTVKGKTEGIARPEYEYPIPVTDAEEMLEDLCERRLVEKNRYTVWHAGTKWEIDDFLGENQGLIVAEVELDTDDQGVTLPDWVGEEMTSDPRYRNAYLARHPYSQWGTSATVDDRVRGILVGLAAGDRNGGPIQMALRLAESLAEHRRFDLEDVAGRYIAWWKEGAYDTGPISARVFSLVASGATFHEASSRVHEESDGLTSGCNPAHRSAPLAMASFLPDDQLARLAAEEAALTHHDPLAGDVAGATVVLCRALVREVAWTRALELASLGRFPRTKSALCPEAKQCPRNGGIAADVLHAAVHFLNRSASFSEALDQSIAFAGLANYCPVLVGAIGGARWGASRIPTLALAHFRFTQRLHTVADALSTEWVASDV